tara:strand:+ start:2705 stop:3829 length:1125 start_codon:yes stop_codon:yes gene_type:complete
MKIYNLLLIYVGLFSLLFSSCSSIEPNSFIIEGSIDVENGLSVYRIKSGPNGQPIKIDSTKTVNNSFIFKGAVDQIDINFLFFEGINGNAPVIIEAGVIGMQVFKDSLESSITDGSLSNNDLLEYRMSTKNYANKMSLIIQEINHANSVGDNILSEDLTSEYRLIEQELSVFEKDFMNTNPNSYIASLILERLVVTKKILPNESKLIFNSFDKKIQNSVSGIKINKIISLPINTTAIGAVAPDFVAPNPLGDQLSLKSLKGKVTIIDFWASWCRPCRIENPNLVRLYKRMHGKGLEIVGVSLDKNKSSWIKAIEDDGLNWKHVSSLKYWKEPVALLYGVRSVPKAFILNKEGIIVAKDLRGRQLDAKVEELLGQ